VYYYQSQKNLFMPYQNISFELPASELAAIKAAITTINQKLPFLIALDPDEVRGLVKLGPKSADFVADASSAVVNFPDVFPASFDKVEFAKDTALFKSMTEIKLLLDSLVEKVDNTYHAIGSESMVTSLHAYSLIQNAAGRTPGLQSVADKLKDRFKGQGRKGPKPSSEQP
jgi:hypothetical protein